MPLSARGRQVAAELDGAAAAVPAGVMGCQITCREELCVGCGRCVAACPAGALRQDGWFDPARLWSAPPATARGAVGAALRRISRHPPNGPVLVPERVLGFRQIVFTPERCLGCGACVRACPTGAVEAGRVAIPRCSTAAPEAELGVIPASSTALAPVEPVVIAAAAPPGWAGPRGEAAR